MNKKIYFIVVWVEDEFDEHNELYFKSYKEALKKYNELSIDKHVYLDTLRVLKITEIKKGEGKWKSLL